MYPNAGETSWRLIGTLICLVFVSLVRPHEHHHQESANDIAKDSAGENLATCQFEQKNVESLMQEQIDSLVAKLEQAEKTTQELERQLTERTAKCTRETTGTAVAATEELQEKLANCGETVKAIRERCDSNQAALKQLTKEHNHLSKTSGNCTEKLKECDTQKSYLEFLKKGYDAVIQDLEKETKVAKESKEKSDKQAKDAIKGASQYRTYLVAGGIVAGAVAAIKVYYVAKSTIQQRTKAILDAKSRDKSEQKKAKRK